MLRHGAVAFAIQPYKGNIIIMNKKGGVVIAIDGPAGAGKSTVARKLARSLRLNYLDTGAMYRSLTLKAMRQHLDLNDEEGLAKLSREMDFETEYRAVKRPPYRILMDGEDVTAKIRTREVSAHVSQASSHLAVRREMVKKQRRLAEDGGIVVEGRDVGTVVFPRADIKFFITASLKERSKRRYREMKKEGHDVSLKSIQQEMVRRDRMDYTRAHNPLKKAPDAIEVDTTSLSTTQVTRKLLRMIRERLGRVGGGR